MAKEILNSKIIQKSLPELCRASRDDVTSLGRAHVLLTGGTGFFGSWMILSFVALREMGLPIEMTVLSRDPDKFLERNPTLKAQDGLSFRKGDTATATIPFSITHVIHLATGESAEKSVHGGGSIVAGTRHMLDEAKRVGAARFLLASSGAVYGHAPQSGDGHAPQGGDGRDYSDGPSETPLQLDANLTPAGIAKREAELLCFDAATARKIETVIARGFTFSGPLFPIAGPYLMSVYMNSLLSRVPIQVKTPNAVRSFLDGRDLVSALWRLLAHGKSGEAYNVGSEESVTMSELADLLRSVAWHAALGVPEIRINPAPQPVDIYRPSIAKIKNELGWRPNISLRESLLAHATWAAE